MALLKITVAKEEVRWRATKHRNDDVRQAQECQQVKCNLFGLSNIVGVSHYPHDDRHVDKIS